MISWLQTGIAASGLVLGAALVPELVSTASQIGAEMPPNCSNARLAAMLAEGPELQMAVAAGSSIPRERRGTYREMARAAAACAKPGTRVVIRPITEHGLIEIPIFDRTAPARIGENEYNDVHYRSDTLAFMKDVDAALDRLPTLGARDRGSDPLGSLIAASRDITITRNAIVLLICNGWQQTRQLNTFSYRTDPARYASTALRFLAQNHTQLQLTDVRVIIAGITAGDPIVDANDAQIEGLCTFWTRIVASGHGTVRCGPSLPGFSDRTVPGNTASG